MVLLWKFKIFKVIYLLFFIFMFVKCLFKVCVWFSIMELWLIDMFIGSINLVYIFKINKYVYFFYEVYKKVLIF